MQINLIALRKNRKENQQNLADLLGISRRQYSLKERGIAKFNGDEMFVIAKHYNLPIDKIFLPTTYQIGELGNESNTKE